MKKTTDTDIIGAARRGNLVRLEELLRKAAAEGSTFSSKTLPARVRSRGWNQNSALHEACRRSKTTPSRKEDEEEDDDETQVRVVDLLLAYGADVNDVNQFGYRPLHFAIERGHVKIVQRLLQAGAYVHSKEPTTSAAKATANVVVEMSSLTTTTLSASGHNDTSNNVVTVAIEQDEDDDDDDDEEEIRPKAKSPLHLAVERGHVKIAQILMETMGGVCDVVEQQQGLPNTANGKGATFKSTSTAASAPLLTACSKGQQDMVRLILKHSSSPSSPTATMVDERGDTPLHRAAKAGHVPVIQQLLDFHQQHQQESNDNLKKSASGVSASPLLLGLENTCKRTALFGPVAQGHADTVGHLLDAGASTVVVDATGKTPYDVALEKGHVDVIKVLIVHSILHGLQPVLPPPTGNKEDAEAGHNNNSRQVKAEQQQQQQQKQNQRSSGDEKAHGDEATTAKGDDNNNDDSNKNPNDEQVILESVRCAVVEPLRQAATRDDEVACIENIIAITDTDDVMRLQVAQAGCLPELLGTMMLYKDDAVIQTLICKTFRNLARNDTNKVLIAMEEGCVEAIISAMNKHLNHAGVQELGCAALNNLALDDQNQVSLAQAGGIETIMQALRNHKQHAGVQDTGCSALNNFALNRENLWAIVQSGAIHVILDTMRRHEYNAEIAKSGCNALRNLAIDDEIEVTIGEAGGVEVVLTAMQEHQKDSEVLDPCCAALRNLSFATENIALVVDGGGIQAILDSMREHPRHVGLQHRSLVVLRNIGTNNDDNRVKIAEAGGIAATLATMSQHANDAEIQEAGCNLLWELGVNDENEVNIAAEGGIKVILSAMRRHITHAGVQHRACGALFMLSFHCAYEVSRYQAAGVARTALWTHRKHKKLKSIGRKFLKKLEASS